MTPKGPAPELPVGPMPMGGRGIVEDETGPEVRRLFSLAESPTGARAPDPDPNPRDRLSTFPTPPLSSREARSPSQAINPWTTPSSLLSSSLPGAQAPSQAPASLDPIAIQPLLISPHHRAPLFGGADAQVVLGDIEREVMGGNFPTTEMFLDVVRQAALVNLFFFLRYVAGFSGAYTKLKRTLHGEMCNFRQMCGVKVGSHGACFVPRSTFKSTVNTHGYAAWKLTREPGETIGIVSSVEDRAKEFYVLARSIMDSNDLYKELFPENVTVKRGDWNDSQLVMPSAPMRKSAPSLSWMSSTGSTAGVHVGEMIFDDLVTDTMLDSQRRATSEMVRMGNWLNSNKVTLLEDPMLGRIFLSATRYAIDDPYEPIMLDSVEQWGEWKEVAEYYPKRKDGEWITYYRSAEVDGHSIFPEKYSSEMLRKMEKDDPWTYNLQYKNFPVGIKSIEFARYVVPKVEVLWSEAIGWYIDVVNRGRIVPLSQCYCVMAVDPAGAEKFTTMKTSRTALVLLAVDGEKNKYIVEAMADYVATTRWFDWMFDTMKKYEGLVQQTVVESQAGFKALESIIRKEQYERGEYLNYRPVPALGDKDTTIRSILQPELERGLLHCNAKCFKNVWEELKAFPASTKKDLLDALKMAVKFAVVPEDKGTNDEEVGEADQSLFGPKRERTASGY